MTGAEEIYRSADLLVRARVGAESSFCIVTFHSYTDERRLEREGFGEDFMASRGVNAIHVIERDNFWFLLPDIEQALHVAAKVARRFDQVSSYGSSMGAYAAIRFGGFAGATKAIALSPQFSIDPRVVPFENRWGPDAAKADYEIEHRLGRRGFVASADILYDPTDQDARHVELFRGCLKVREVCLPNCGHPVTGFLAEVGLLQRAVLEAAQGVLDAAAFEREARAKRESSPQYFAMLALRSSHNGEKLELMRRAYQLAPRNVGYITLYAVALAKAKRRDEAMARLNEAMAIAPDHHYVMRWTCKFLASTRRLSAARAVAEWLARLHPGAAPIEAIRDQVNRRRLSDAGKRLRNWRAELSRFAGACATSFPNATASPPRERLIAPPGAPPARIPASPPTVHSWILHADAIGAAPASAVDIVLVGDSLAHKWPGRAWHQKRVFNLGVSGDRTQHVLWRLACFGDGALRAKAAVLIIGVNNLVCGEDIQAIVEAIINLVSEIRRVVPGAKVAVVSLPPFGPEFCYRDDDRRRLNEALTNIPDAVCVAEPADWSPLGAEARCYQPDAVHFTQTGYERLTAATARALADR
jgi:GDSL-like Lipase/Acylhydrolase family